MKFILTIIFGFPILIGIGFVLVTVAAILFG